jgi:drug/metabolite transporter (DMT)-like permease
MVYRHCRLWHGGTAQATNMILAHANGGYIPAYTLAFFRWAIVALDLLPLSFAELHSHQNVVRSRWWQIFITGFLEMFVCGGPIYIAAVTTIAINIGLIMARSPVVVLVVSWSAGPEIITRLERLGIVMALIGALFVMSRGPAGCAFLRNLCKRRRDRAGRDVGLVRLYVAANKE